MRQLELALTDYRSRGLTDKHPDVLSAEKELELLREFGPLFIIDVNLAAVSGECISDQPNVDVAGLVRAHGADLPALQHPQHRFGQVARG